MISTSENVSLNSTITVVEDNIEKPVLIVNSTMSKDNYGFNINLNVINKDLLMSHAEEVQTQLNEFITQIRAKMNTLQFPVTI